MDMKLLALFITVFISGCRAGATCWYYDDYYVYYQAYCEDGCCGSHESDVCCDDSATIGIIVGATVGGIIFLSLLVSFTCCCIFMMKRSQKPGMVIHPANGNHVTAISTGIQQPAPPPYGFYPNYEPHNGCQLPTINSSSAPTAPLPPLRQGRGGNQGQHLVDSSPV